jgi:outer membrane protein
MKSFILSISFWLAIPCCIMALPDDDLKGTTLSLGQVLDMALKTRPETEVAYWNAQRAADANRLAHKNYYPLVDLEANVTQSRDYKFRKGPETTFLKGEANLLLSYLLLDFGERRAQVQATQAILTSLQWESNWIIQKVLSEVLNQAYEYLESRELLISDMSSLNDANIVLKAAEELNRAGLRSISDVYTSQANLTEMQLKIAEQEAERDIAQSKLALSIGLQAQDDIQMENMPNPLESHTRDQELDSLLVLAQGRRADLESKRAQVDEKIALYNQVRSLDKPRVTFDARGGIKHYSEDRAKGYNYAVALTFEVPIFRAFESTYQRKIACDQIKITEAEKNQLEWDIAFEVMTSYRQFKAAQEIWGYSLNHLHYSLKAYESVLEKYRAGTETIFDLTQAQEKLAEARSKVSVAKMRWYRSMAKLAYATGTFMPFVESSCPNSP